MPARSECELVRQRESVASREGSAKVACVGVAVSGEGGSVIDIGLDLDEDRGRAAEWLEMRELLRTCCQLKRIGVLLSGWPLSSLSAEDSGRCRSICSEELE